MADEMSIKAEGLKKVQETYKSLSGPAKARFIRNYVRKTGLEGWHFMAKKVPVAYKIWKKGRKRGRLRSSLTKKDQRDGYGFWLGTTVDYGLWVKLGIRWRGEPSSMGPRPYDEWTVDHLDRVSSTIAEAELAAMLREVIS